MNEQLQLQLQKMLYWRGFGDVAKVGKTNEYKCVRVWVCGCVRVCIKAINKNK